MRQQCGNCGRPFALTFERCPSCGTPAGSKGHSSLPKALPRKEDPEPEPRAAANTDLALDFESEPGAGADAKVELDLGAPAPPQNLMSIPDLDLSGIAPRRSEAAPDLELAPPAVPPIPSTPAAHPSDELPVERNETPSPIDSAGPAAWEAAARSQRVELPKPTAAPAPPSAFGALLAAQRPLSHRAGPSAAVLFARILTWMGVACVALGFLPVGCWQLFYSFKKVEVKELASVTAGKRVELVDGVADWNAATIVDLDSPTELGEPSELRRRSESLKGKLVSVTAAPLGAYMYKQYRVGADGQREEIPGVTRVYTPLTLDNSVWAVSELLQASSFDDPDVKAEVARLQHTGVVQLLSENVSLDDIRNPQNVSRSPSVRSHVPDDALAIVSVQRSGENKKYTVARIAGTQGRYVAVSTGERPGSDESLFGEVHPCPSKTCQSFAAALPVEPAGVLVLSQMKAFPWTAHIALFMLLGIGCAVGGVVLKRRLSE